MHARFDRIDELAGVFCDSVVRGRDVLQAGARVLARPDLARVDLGLEVSNALPVREL